MRVRSLLFAFALLLFPQPARADCTSPASPAGGFQYFSADSIWKACDGTNWINFFCEGSPTCTNFGSCTQASGLTYDTSFTPDAYKFCDGTNWKKVSCPSAAEADVTWDTVQKGTNVTLSNGDLDATCALAYGSCGMAVSSYGLSGGKAYLEIETVTGDDNAEVGVKDDNFSILNDFHIDLAGGNVHYDNFASGFIEKSPWDVVQSYNTDFVTGTIHMWALDRTSGKIWYGRNGTWVASGNPAADTNHIATGSTSVDWHASVFMADGATFRLRTKASEFDYSIPSGFSSFASAVGSNCSFGACSQNGAIDYISGSAVLAYCDGLTWTSMHDPGTPPPPPCDDPGDICPDGSIYVGLSPDGNVPMYTTRCNSGRTWDGAACTGTAITRAYNNGNSSGTTSVSGAASATAGEANTTALLAADSDSVTGGTQPHLAAQYCDTLDIHGNQDWYLPATNELAAVLGNLCSYGYDGILNLTTWTSAQASAGNANRRARSSCSSSSSGSSAKNTALTVRCVRK